MALPSEPRVWTKNEFTVSTDRSLLSVDSINAAFAQDFMYWTKPFPDDILRQILDQSFCFGVYKPNPTSDNLQQIGFARLVTDTITFAYLTDVYILPEYQGLGLGGWLLDCVDELIRPLPYLRWSMLRTSSEKSKQSYEKRMDMVVLDCGNTQEGAIMMGRKGKANMA
ncbi:GNAT family N-acetyltransferase [Aspergillus terreus]|uniref:GNAT family N-acetyltransferase n=1 Tax=Aspergillus terreus TaxID=33178 RepID=A0A5M3YWZ6_ASPTE|nr:hypothetical protein ATETN484_0003087000 [Aspergillus terreus]GFF14856.1 GNAT family N-acetyltransferase [Aspergillus terreus]